MQNEKMSGAILLGVVVFFFVYQQLGAPALLLLAVVAGALLLLRYKLRSYPEAGWRYIRAFAFMAALATGGWTAVALLSGSLPVALVSGLVFAGTVLWINLCTRKMGAASGVPALVKTTASPTASEAQSGDSPIPSATPAFQNMLDMDQHTYVIMANNRRSSERGQKMRAQGEVLDLMRQNRELQAEIDGLKGQLKLKQHYDSLPPDPFADCTAGSLDPASRSPSAVCPAHEWLAPKPSRSGASRDTLTLGQVSERRLPFSHLARARFDIFGREPNSRGALNIRRVLAGPVDRDVRNRKRWIIEGRDVRDLILGVAIGKREIIHNARTHSLAVLPHETLVLLRDLKLRFLAWLAVAVGDRSGALADLELLVRVGPTGEHWLVTRPTSEHGGRYQAGE